MPSLAPLVRAGGVWPRAPAWELPKVHPARVRLNTDMFSKSVFVFRTNHVRADGAENEFCKRKVSHH